MPDLPTTTEFTATLATTLQEATGVPMRRRDAALTEDRAPWDLKVRVGALKPSIPRHGLRAFAVEVEISHREYRADFGGDSFFVSTSSELDAIAEEYWRLTVSAWTKAAASEAGLGLRGLLAIAPGLYPDWTLSFDAARESGRFYVDARTGQRISLMNEFWTHDHEDMRGWIALVTRLYPPVRAKFIALADAHPVSRR